MTRPQFGSQYNVPHGVALALFLPHVIRFNSTDAPTRITAFPGYPYPMAKVSVGAQSVHSHTLPRPPTTLLQRMYRYPYPMAKVSEGPLPVHSHGLTLPGNLVERHCCSCDLTGRLTD